MKQSPLGQRRVTDNEGGPPTYDVDVEADELIADIAELAAEYGADFEEKRQWWQESPAYDPFTEAEMWMLEARGGQRACGKAVALLQPESAVAGCSEFRDADGTVDVRGYMRWLLDSHDAAHERSYGGHRETRQADEAESAYSRILSLLRDEYGVGWPRLNSVSGTPVEKDLP